MTSGREVFAGDGVRGDSFDRGSEPGQESGDGDRIQPQQADGRRKSTPGCRDRRSEDQRMVWSFPKRAADGIRGMGPARAGQAHQRLGQVCGRGWQIFTPVQRDCHECPGPSDQRTKA